TTGREAFPGSRAEARFKKRRESPFPPAEAGAKNSLLKQANFTGQIGWSLSVYHGCIRLLNSPVSPSFSFAFLIARTDAIGVFSKSHIVPCFDKLEETGDYR
ncbi:MAG TPA: hypothetical protein PKH31_12450, partial [Candidatus Sumerlaeota bacterium]|nr:hypothetical protein [Candidatus Sumerlaeota bacterium]